MQFALVPRRHLSESELLDCTDVCPICRSTAARSRVIRVQSAPDVYMLACMQCGGSSASHMPRREVLEEYYSRYYEDRQDDVTFSRPVRFARHLARLLRGHALPRAMKILDYGGGDGSLATELARLLIARRIIDSAEILVVDYATHSAAVHDSINVRYQSPEAAIPGAYDLVLASAILEHVPDLFSLLQRLRSSMAEHAVFYARTPYVLPLAKLSRRLDLGYPAHVHDLGVGFWNRVAATFDWPVKVVSSRPSIVANTLRNDPLRALAGLVLKAPGRVENMLSSRERKSRIWPFVGGWEVLLQKQ